MTDHLPECPLLEPCDDEVADHGYCSMQHGVFCIHCQQWCICDRLRACEQRVREDERMQILATAGLSWDEAIAIMSPQDAVNILQQQHKEKP